MDKRIFSIPELAEAAETTVAVVEAWIQENDVPVHFAGGRRLVDLGELAEEVIEALFEDDDDGCDEDEDGEDEDEGDDDCEDAA